MANLEMKVPSPGESISEVEIATWLVADGDYVTKDQAIAEVDSDKATLELPAEESGVITLKAAEGEVVKVGQVVCLIDTSALAPANTPKTIEKETAVPSIAVEKAPNPDPIVKESSYAAGSPSPAALKIMNENNISAAQVVPTGKDGRITKNDVNQALSAGFDTQSMQGWGGTRTQTREKMSMLRRKIAERLVHVKNETAMLTTFNEVDMKPVMDLRSKYKDKFKEKHGVGLGFMSFFTKAVCVALKEFPSVNAKIDGEEIVYHDYCDISIAVSAPKGLVVPVIRSAENLSLAGIESEVVRLAGKARENKLSLEEMSGGTFTITNGGVFGSMLSTPIINAPQVAILGMHNIVERPVVVNLLFSSIAYGCA